MKLSRLGQIAIPVSDADRSDRFFGEILGLPRLFRFGTLVFFDCNGVRLMLEGSGTVARSPGGVCHYFAVEDIGNSVEVLAARGVTFDDRPHLIAKMSDHELWMCFFKDPDGNQFALMEERRHNSQ